MFAIIEVFRGHTELILFGLISSIISVFIENKRKGSTKWSTLLVAIGGLYIVAKCCQLAVIGPRFIRFWVTDVGFISGFTYVFFLLVRNKKGETEAMFFGWRISCALAFIVELATLMIADSVGEVKKQELISSNANNGTAMGDYIDLIIFVVMAVITFFIIKMHIAVYKNRLIDSEVTAKTDYMRNKQQKMAEKKYKKV